jgi:hypothetical protein
MRNGRRDLLEEARKLKPDSSDKQLNQAVIRLLSKHRPGIIRPEKSRKDYTRKALGAKGACSKEEAAKNTKRNSPKSNKKNNPINNPIWNLINNPKSQLKAKEAKERLILGCTFAEFIVLSLQEQQRGLPGFTELSAMIKVVNDARSAEERKRLNRVAVKPMEVTSPMTLQTALAKVETQVEEALSLFKWSAENEQAEGAAGAHCCKYSHLSVIAAVGEIATNISERTGDHRKGRLVNKEKDAFDWMDKEDMLDCLKAITPVIKAGKCGYYHHPNGDCAIAIVYNSLPLVNPSSFFESGVVERAAIIAVRGAVADGSQGTQSSGKLPVRRRGSVPIQRHVLRRRHRHSVRPA